MYLNQLTSLGMITLFIDIDNNFDGSIKQAMYFLIVLASTLALSIGSQSQVGHSHPSQPAINLSPIYSQAPVHFVTIGETLAGDYQFGYDTGRGPLGRSFRQESRSSDGTVRGSYGYIDNSGEQRIVRYTAGRYGFVIDSDEPTSAAPVSHAGESRYTHPILPQNPPSSSFSRADYSSPSFAQKNKYVESESLPVSEQIQALPKSYSVQQPGSYELENSQLTSPQQALGNPEDQLSTIPNSYAQVQHHTSSNVVRSNTVDSNVVQSSGQSVIQHEPLFASISTRPPQTIDLLKEGLRGLQPAPQLVQSVQEREFHGPAVINAALLSYDIGTNRHHSHHFP